MSNELETQIEDDLFKDKVSNFFKIPYFKMLKSEIMSSELFSSGVPDNIQILFDLIFLQA